MADEPIITEARPAVAAEVTDPPVSDQAVVFITHPDTEGVGTASLKAFREVWEPKGWVRTTQEAFEEHDERLKAEAGAFVAAGIAPPPDGDAQDVINAERAGRRRPAH